MAIRISFCAVLFVIFSGLFIAIDTKHHSRHHHFQKYNLNDWEEDRDSYYDHSLENNYGYEEAKRAHHHKSRKNRLHDSDSSEEYRPRKHGHRNIDMDLMGRAVKPPKPPQSSEAFKAEGLKVHNELREAHGVPPLAIDEELCDLAELWAKEIGDGSDSVKKVVLSHTPEMTHEGGVGDNIFACKCYDITGDRASRFWYMEEKKYNYSNPHYHWTWGHFTQVVWKETNKFGIAKYKSPIMGFIIVVATYLPRGNMNYTKSFRDNVLPPKKKPRQMDIPMAMNVKALEETLIVTPIVTNNDTETDNVPTSNDGATNKEIAGRRSGRGRQRN